MNIRLLKDFARSGRSPILHIATHLANLIKVSDRVTVRHNAGNALLKIAPLLSVDQRNEVAVELCRGLELGRRSLRSTSPTICGRFALWLPPEELDEIIVDLGKTLCSRAAASSPGARYGGRHLRGVRRLRTRFPETDEGLPRAARAPARYADEGPRRDRQRDAPRGHACAGAASVRFADPQRAREEPRLPAHRAQDPRALSRGSGRWADVLLPRGHARAALPLHHGAES